MGEGGSRGSEKKQKCKTIFIYKQLSRGEICVTNFKAPLGMVRVWTGFQSSHGIVHCPRDPQKCWPNPPMAGC